MTRIVSLLLIASLGWAQDAPPKPIDFSKVPRGIAKQPRYVAAPLFGLFLFGKQGEKRVWAVLDKSAPDAATYDVLYLDRNADGELGADERYQGAVVAAAGRANFTIGRFRDPASEAVHTEFKLTYNPSSVSFSMRWRGKELTMGLYGPESSTYAKFATSPKDAPVFVPGYDRPLEFEHWMSGTLQRGGVTDFKVFVGHRGSRRGAFCSSDDKFLPAGEYVAATLIYTDVDGKRKRFQAKLTERC